MQKSSPRILGLLGGMSWESSAMLYALINREVAARQGGLHSARLLLWSVDFDEIAHLQREDRWDEAGRLLSEAAAGLHRAGAGALMLATNTMHRVAPAIEAGGGLPLLHLVDLTADALKRQGITRAALMGTRYTMAPGFYTERMAAQGIELVTPQGDDAEAVHRIIFEELCRGDVHDSSRQTLLCQARELAAQGAQALILGCTELGLLLDDGVQQDSPLPFFDSTRLQAQAAAEWLLAP
jgi:aspartate racemase